MLDHGIGDILAPFIKKVLPSMPEMYNLFYYHEDVGVFVLEEDLFEFIKGFLEKTSVGVTDSKITDCVEGIKDRFADKQYYIEGSQVSVGYLIHEMSSKLRHAFRYAVGIQIPQCRPERCLRLHDRDPLFYTKNLRPPARRGIVAEIVEGKNAYLITLYAFHRFCERVPQEELGKHTPKERDLLEKFLNLFLEAVPAKRVNARDQLERHQEDSKYRLNGNLVFVLNADDVIKTCYWKEEGLPFPYLI